MSKMTLDVIINRNPEWIHVRFSSEDAPHRTVPIELVLDFDQFGSVFGIEIVSLKFLGGQNALPVRETHSGSDQVEFSYDEEADAAGLLFKRDRSLDQRAVNGWLEIDNEGRLVGIKAELGQ